MPTSISIDDVARAAGVSRKTVSRVLNGEAYVREEKKDAVLKAITALGYTPNPAARSLAAGRSYLIGLLTPRVEWFQYYFHELHRQTIRAARDAGFHVLLEEVASPDDEALQRLERNLAQMRFDGLILAPPISSYAPVLKLLNNLSLRHVRLQPSQPHANSDSVSANDVQGAQAIADHLSSLGHRKIVIGHVGPKRHDQLKAALIGKGVAEKGIQSIAIDWKLPPFEAGRQLCRQTLALKKSARPTAVFTHADEVAAGFVSHALDQGIGVPQQLAVIGYDGSPIAESAWPGITTIRQPIEAMARQAMALLLDKNTRAPSQITLPVELIARGSTARNIVR